MTPLLLEYTVVVLTVLGLGLGVCAFILKRIERLNERTRSQVKDLYGAIAKLKDSTMSREEIDGRLKRIERNMNGLIAKCAPKRAS